MYDGTITYAMAAMIGAATSERPAMANTVSSVMLDSVLNVAPLAAPLAVPTSARNSAPAMPAMNAEMQKMMTRVILASAPLTASATGASARPRNSRPSLLRLITTAARMLRAATTAQT